MATGAATVDYERLVSSISRGVADGNSALISQLVMRSDKNHDLSGAVQANIDKVYNLDTEVRVMKGVVFTLLGSGDGSSGMVPGLQKNMTEMGGEVQEIKSDVNQIKRDVAKLLQSSSEQKSWTDGWKGVGVAIGLIGTCLTIMGSLIAGLVWLFTHASHGTMSGL